MSVYNITVHDWVRPYYKMDTYLGRVMHKAYPYTYIYSMSTHLQPSTNTALTNLLFNMGINGKHSAITIFCDIN